MLDAGHHVVPLQVLLDLALLLALGRLVDRHLDEMVAGGHHLRHQGRVFGRDVGVIEVLEHRELEHVLVPLDPVVHLPFLDVADAVIDELEAAGVFAVVGVEGELDRCEIGREEAALLQSREGVLAGSAHEGVDRSAVGLDGRHRDAAAIIGDRPGFADGSSAVRDGSLERLLGIVDGEGDVLHTVAESREFRIDRVIRGKRGLEDESNVALGQQVSGGVAASRGEIRDLAHFESEGVRVEDRGLLRVAHEEADMIDIDQLQGVGGGRAGRRGRGAGSGHCLILKYVTED